MNKCIYCNTSDNLTTSMQVTSSHGTKMSVWVCNTHEDNASPKQIRELVDKKESMLLEFEKQAAELGYKLVPLNQLMVVESPKVEAQSQHVQPEHINGQKQGIKPLPAVKPQKKTMQPVVTNTTVEGLGAVEQHSSYDTSKPVALKDGTIVEAPVVMEHELQTVTGRGGVPISIPKKIAGNDGTTQINIVDTGGDAALQQRFREITGSKEAQSFSKGYKTRDCTFCNGTGINRISKDKCPKCGGKGMF